MTLAWPLAAFGVGGTAIALLTLLYLVRRRRVRVVVPSIWLWRRAGELRAHATSLRRLRRLLSWLVNAMAIGLLAAALGRPLLGRSGQGGARVVVLDASASMQAREPDGRSRFAEALAIARRIADRATVDAPVAIVLAAADPRLLVPFADDPGTVGRALDAASAEDGVCDLGAAIDLSRGVARAFPQGEVVILSDGGAPAGRLPTAADDVPVSFVRVGSERPNLGVTGFALAPAPGSDDLFDGIVRLWNEGPSARAAELVLRQDGRVMDDRPIELPPAVETVVSLRRAFVGPAVVSVEIRSQDGPGSGDDALAADDRATALVPAPRPIRVALRPGPNDFFLEQAIGAAQGELIRVGPDDDPDVTIVHDGGPLPDGPLLVFGAAPTGLPFLPGEPRPLGGGPSVKGWAERSPILAGASLADLHVRRARPIPLPLPDGWKSIVDGVGVVGGATGSPGGGTSEGPLVVAGRREGGARTIYVAFDPEESDWPLRVAFPLFLANGLSYLRGEAPRAVAVAVAAGTPLPIPDGLREAARTAFAAGDPRPLAVSFQPASGWLSRALSVEDDLAPDAPYDKTGADGIYSVFVRGAHGPESRFPVSTTDVRESRLAPSGPPFAGLREVPVASLFTPGGSLAPWRLLALVALALLLFELWLARRGRLS